MKGIHAPRPTPSARRGFTLLELIVYLGMVSLIIVSATLFFLEFVISNAKSLALEQVTRNSRYALSRVALEIREASDVNTGSSTFGANPSTLSLASASGPLDPTVFTVSANTLNIQQGGGAVTPLTNSKVDVVEFVVDDISTSGRTKVFRVRLKLKARNIDNLQQLVAEQTVETTVPIYKNDGFSN